MERLQLFMGGSRLVYVMYPCYLWFAEVSGGEGGAVPQPSGAGEHGDVGGPAVSTALRARRPPHSERPRLHTVTH